MNSEADQLEKQESLVGIGFSWAGNETFKFLSAKGAEMCPLLQMKTIA